MSSPATRVVPPAAGDPIRSLERSTGAELIRLRRWPAVWVLIGAWFVLSTLFGYVFNYVAYKSGSDTFSNTGQNAADLLASVLPASVPHTLVQGTPMFGGALVMVLGAIVAGNGFGWGTWKTVFTQGPSRTAATIGSLIALTAFVAGIVVSTLALDLGLSLLVAAVEAQPVVWPSAAATSQGAGICFLVLWMWAASGYLLGILAKGPAVSVGLGLVWALVIENLLRGVGSAIGAIDAITHFTPGTAAGSLAGWFIGTGTGNDTPGVLDALSGPRALWTLLAWLAVLIAGSVLIIRCRDVS
jgi:ABC-2 type transport system permease protein